MNQPAPIIEETKANTTGSRSTFRRWAVFVSIAFHIALLIGLFVWRTSLPKPSMVVALAGQSASRSDDQSATERLGAERIAYVPLEQIEKSLASQIEQVKRLPDERKLSELEKNLGRLESVADPQSIQ